MLEKTYIATFPNSMNFKTDTKVLIKYYSGIFKL